MTTIKTENEAPIIAAEFPDKRQLWAAVQALEDRRIGRDFIGVFIGENGFKPGGSRELLLLSALAPRRLHEELKATLTASGATAVGSPKAISELHGVVPHPGSFEDHDLKLPLGDEFPRLRARLSKA